MKIPVLLFASSLLFGLQPNGFDSLKPGELPSEWSTGATGEGTAMWSVAVDKEAKSSPNVLRQSGRAAYTWCVDKRSMTTDGSVEAMIKPISGNEDQAGGVVWRWKNAENYYIARINSIEDNVILFSMVNGRRHTLKSIDIKVAPQIWHSLKVEYRGRHIVVHFDGKTVLENDNDEISGPGLTGLWTKSDSVTDFDDFQFVKL